MATITIPVSFFFNGNVQGNPGDTGNPLRVTPTNDPFAAFSPDAGATVQITVADSAVTSTDADGDGTVENTIGNGVRIQQILVDLDGDGIYESEITGQNPNDLDTNVSNQTGSNIVRFNGNLSLSQNGGTPQPFSQANLYIANNEPAFDAYGTPQAVEILNSGNNFIISDPNDTLFPMICLLSNTPIITQSGPVPVGDIQIGQMVLTLDNGFQPVRWVFKRTVTPLAMHAHAHLRPVTIPAHSHGHNLPAQDIQMSRKHRILQRGAGVELHFGVTEALSPAHSDPAATTHIPNTSVTYVHLLFDSHEIINSHGLWTESFHPGEVGFGTIDAQTRALIETQMPVAAQNLHARNTARLCLTHAQATALTVPLTPAQTPDPLRILS